MACYSYPLHHESASRYPHVDRVSVGEEDHVDFIYQFVEDSYTSHLSHECSKKTVPKIIGTPSKFPNYGDFPGTFVMRVNGFDISMSWQNKTSPEPFLYMSGAHAEIKEAISENFIVIEFEEAVYPIRVSMYEIYNPGNVIRICAEDPNDKWFPLWNGRPQIVPPTSRLFSPPLRWCDFKTKSLRIDFKERDSIWDYYTKLDAVMLIGTSELIFPRNPKQSLTDLLQSINCKYPCHGAVHNLTPDYKNPHSDISHLQEKFCEHCIICKSDKSFHKLRHKQAICRPRSMLGICRQCRPYYLPPCKQSGFPLKGYFNKKCVKNIILSSNKFEGLSRCSLSALPVEIILKIFKNLDLTSLSRMSKVNKYFHNLTRDPLLYTSLNLRNITYNPYNPKFMYSVFCYFTPRCTYLQRLDLSYSFFPLLRFINFLKTRGKLLTHLRLRFCRSINRFALCEISKICKNLKELDLFGCDHINDNEFWYLKNLEFLEHLNLCHVHIRTQHLCKILQRNRRMRDLNLAEVVTGDADAVAMELRNSCPELEVINLQNVFTLTSRGIDALADCKKLRKVNLNYCCHNLNHWIATNREINERKIRNDSLCRLFSSCQRLEEVELQEFYSLTDRVLNALRWCKNLKKLDLRRVVPAVSPDILSALYELYPDLQIQCWTSGYYECFYEYYLNPLDDNLL